MSDKIFLDSNVLVYLFSDDEPEKQQIARKLVHGSSCMTGINNLNEMNSVPVRKKKLSFSKAELTGLFFGRLGRTMTSMPLVLPHCL